MKHHHRLAPAPATAAAPLASSRLAAALLAGLFSGSLLAAPIAVRVQNMDLEPNQESAEPAVSADGKTVVFISNATNLTAPGHGELFTYSVISDTIRPLTTNVDGNNFKAAVSANGRYVAFSTDDNEIGSSPTECLGTGFGYDVLRVDTWATPLTYQRVSRAAACSPNTPTATNGSSNYPAISGDGNFVAFVSGASNLVTTPATTPGRDHIYEMNMTTRQLTLVTAVRNQQGTLVEANADQHGAGGIENNAYSSDGTKLVFTNASSNLTSVEGGNNYDVILRRIDRNTGAVTFENMNRNLATGANGVGSSDRGSISPNGQYVIFLSSAANLLPTGRSPSTFFVRDLVNNTLRPLPLPPGMGTCNRGRIDNAGQAVLFCSPAAPNPPAQQLFQVRPDGTTRLLSQRFDGDLNDNFANGRSGAEFSLSADGRMLVTESAASDLIAVDNNNVADIFMIAEPEVFDELFRDGFED
jgi:Tol biopolymer transport system component